MLLTWDLAHQTLAMRLLHRAINLIVALTLVAIGGGGVVYFYLIEASWPPGDDGGVRRSWSRRIILALGRTH
jgi:hypothetical protein